VNDPPAITEGDSTTVIMSEDGAPTAFSLTLNAADVDSATLTWSLSAAAAHGTATVSGTGSSRAISYVPAAAGARWAALAAPARTQPAGSCPGWPRCWRASRRGGGGAVRWIPDV
jgi:hypothetical protein